MKHAVQLQFIRKPSSEQIGITVNQLAYNNRFSIITTTIPFSTISRDAILANPHQDQMTEKL